jgi:electron transport complex protein RnfA
VLGGAAEHQPRHNFLQSALYGFSAAVGFSLVMVLFAAIRERLAVADVPAPFRGNAIALITAGLMSWPLWALVVW